MAQLNRKVREESKLLDLGNSRFPRIIGENKKYDSPWQVYATDAAFKTKQRKHMGFIEILSLSRLPGFCKSKCHF